MNALTIRSLLPNCAPGAWLRERFTDSDLGRQLARKLPASIAKDSIGQLLSDQIQHVLDTNLIELLVGGWLRYHELAKLARGEGALVELAKHRLSSSHEPRIELILDGTTIANVRLRLVLELEVSAVQLLLLRGRVREVRVGEVDAAGILELEGHELVRQALTHIELPGVIRLDPGIALPGSKSEA